MPPRIIGPKDGKYVDLDGLGVRFMAWTEETGGGFSLVEHPIAPNTMAAPWHRHTREDEYSYVLEGRMGALLGDEVIYAEAGELAFKPRDQWHTFWNAGDTPCRILEVISPGGFEHFFREFDETTKHGAFDPVALGERYGIEFDLEAVPRICAEHGLVHPLLDAGSDSSR